MDKKGLSKYYPEYVKTSSRKQNIDKIVHIIALILNKIAGRRNKYLFSFLGHFQFFMTYYSTLNSNEMIKQLLNSVVLTFLSGILFFGCSEEDSAVPNAKTDITSIQFTASKEVFKPIENDSSVFKITDQNDVDISDLVKITLNGASYKSLFYKSEVKGVFEFTAEYDGIISNTLSIEANISPTQLTVSFSKNSISSNGTDVADIIIMDEDMDNIARHVEIYNGSTLLEDPSFNSKEAGSFAIYAKHGDVESSPASIEVTRFIVRKILIEEFTGEWCGWCPQAAYNLDLLVKENENVLTTGIHNGDRFEYDFESNLRAKFGLNYFPSGLVGRVNLGSAVGYNECFLGDEINAAIESQLYSESAKVEISVNSVLSGNNAQIDVEVSFVESTSDASYLTVYIIENDVVGGTHENYFSNGSYLCSAYYSQPARIDNYVHQYVLQEVGTDAFGDLIPSGEAVANNIYKHATINMDLSGYNTDKCHIIAFVHPSLDADDKTILNAQMAKVGENKGF
jgi:hypothetical protein